MGPAISQQNSLKGFNVYHILYVQALGKCTPTHVDIKRSNHYPISATLPLHRDYVACVHVLLKHVRNIVTPCIGLALLLRRQGKTCAIAAWEEKDLRRGAGSKKGLHTVEA